VPEVDSAERTHSFWLRWLLMVVLGPFARGAEHRVALFAAPLAATFRGFHQRPV
jgi:hypothetical protein